MGKRIPCLAVSRYIDLRNGGMSFSLHRGESRQFRLISRFTGSFANNSAMKKINMKTMIKTPPRKLSGWVFLIILALAALYIVYTSFIGEIA
jgi:hypothetical protein